jgi:hypothetical protein
MQTLVFWLYIFGFTLLILHEMDSVYWHEWKLFSLPGGKNAFILFHLPLIPVFLYGVIPVHEGAGLGIVFAVVLSFLGIVAFCLHMFFFVKGKEEFKTPFSVGLLVVLMIVSVLQLVIIASMKIT